MDKRHKQQETPSDNTSGEDSLQQLSKTRAKKQMQDLQDIGVSLTKLKLDRLKRLQLPEKLFDAIKSVHTINANGALRRQHQYIGKLMRDLDEQVIQSIRNHLIEKGI